MKQAPHAGWRIMLLSVTELVSAAFHRVCVQVGARIISKRIHVRVEHVQPSRCREDFLKRRVTNDAIKHDAKVKGGEWSIRVRNGHACMHALGACTCNTDAS